MYITPNSTIYILKNCPLNSTYEHTYYFDTKDEQFLYFSGLMKYKLDKQSYTRANKGSLRVQLLCDNLFDCNYLMFQNTAYGNKWFYAFIKSVDYINNSVSEITYEIDVLQTWHFNYTLRSCFIEREHTATDGLYENIVDENLNIGEDFVVNSEPQKIDLSDMSVTVLLTKDLQGNIPDGKVYNNIFSPLYFSTNYRLNAPADLNELSTAIKARITAGQTDEIVNIYQYPTKLFGIRGGVFEPYEEEVTVTLNESTLDGYTPKNNKLFNYPYNFIQVTNNMGSQATLKNENWERAQRGKVMLQGVIVSSPSAFCYPKYYLNKEDNYDEGLTISNFPQCPWQSDTYYSWLNQNKNSVATSTITSALTGLATTVVTGGNVGAGLATGLLGTGVTVANLMAKTKDMQAVPPQARGQTQTESLLAGTGRYGFTFYTLSIKAENARIIDDYFSRYGYACRKIKQPNRKVRPHWTYTKTIGCTISGELPSDDIAKICSIFDNGITYWTNGSIIGDYSPDNSPIP